MNSVIMHVEFNSLPDRLAQAQSAAWVLLTSIRPLQHHEDEAVQELAFDAATALIALLRALNRLEAVVGEEE